MPEAPRPGGASDQITCRECGNAVVALFRRQIKDQNEWIWVCEKHLPNTEQKGAPGA